MLPEDDLRIETCRSGLNVFSVKILDYYNITVHWLVCDKLAPLLFEVLSFSVAGRHILPFRTGPTNFILNDIFKYTPRQ